MVPESIIRENITMVYLRVLPDKKTWFGSLEFLDNVEAFGGLLRWIEDGLKRVVETVSTSRVVSGSIELLDKYDIVIINTLFTGTTGRVGKEFEESSFGFIPVENNKEILEKRYDKIRERVEQYVEPLRHARNHSIV